MVTPPAALAAALRAANLSMIEGAEDAYIYSAAQSSAWGLHLLEYLPGLHASLCRNLGECTGAACWASCPFSLHGPHALPAPRRGCQWLVVSAEAPAGARVLP